MPIYEYNCKNCNEIFEEFQSVGASNENIVCPKCGAPHPERIFSAFSSSGALESGKLSGSCGSSSSPFT